MIYFYSHSILDDLNNGYTILLDRYVLSGVVYSAAKGLDIDWCISPDIGLPLPDIVFFLNLSIDEISKRGDFGNERYEKLDFQKKVLSNFLLLKEKMPKLNWVDIDASRTIDSINVELFDRCNSIIESVQEKEINYF